MALSAHWQHPSQIYGNTFSDPRPSPAVYCAECNDSSSYGTGGGDAESRDEAIVGAYANGWYVGKSLIICLACRKKITPDNVDESCLQTN